MYILSNINFPHSHRFHSLTAWNNEKGAEWVNGGAIQFHDFYLVNNQVAGVEMKEIVGAEPYSRERGAMIKNGIIIASDESSTLYPYSTGLALILPVAYGLIVEGTTFVNFEGGSAALGVAKITGRTSTNNGGFTYRFGELTFINSPNKASFRWEHDAVFEDMDGTLTGISGGSVSATEWSPFDTIRCLYVESHRNRCLFAYNIAL